MVNVKVTQISDFEGLYLVKEQLGHVLLVFLLDTNRKSYIVKQHHHIWSESPSSEVKAKDTQTFMYVVQE